MSYMRPHLGGADVRKVLAVGIAYFLLAKLGLQLASYNPSATPVWPPTGFALAMVLLFGQRIWLGVFAGALIANATTAGSLATSLGIAAGNTLEAAVGGLLIEKWCAGRRTFDTSASVAKFALISIGPAALISATIGVSSLWFGGFIGPGQFSSVWMTWWIGDFASALLLTPVIMLWASLGSRPSQRDDLLETMLLMAVTCAIGLVAFNPPASIASSRGLMTFLAMAPLLWAALRRGPRDTATVALLLACFAVWGAAAGNNPFVNPGNRDESFLQVTMFIIGAALPSLVLSAEVTMRSHATAAVRENEERLRLAIEAAGIGTFAIDPQTGIARYSPELSSMLGFPDVSEVRVEDAFTRVHREDVARVRGLYEAAFNPGSNGRLDMEFRFVRPGGEVRWTAWSGRVHFNMRTSGRKPVRVVGTCVDITERKLAEVRLRAAHDTFRHLVDRSPFGIFAVDADFRLVQVSDGAQKVFEDLRPLIGRDVAEVLRLIWPEPFATEAIGRFRHTLATGEPYHSQSTVGRRADIGAAETFDWKIERVTLPDGRSGVVCHFYDLSERQRHEDHIKLLMQEVNHRSKNMLALVDAIAQQTTSTGPDDFFQRFSERIQSLAASQDLLVEHDWKAVPLANLVRSQLSHFADLIGARISLSGPPLSLAPGVAQSLGMALHELGTNAAKYGALSTEFGRVAITWNVHAEGRTQPQFTLSWVEQGGPAVRVPERSGYGSAVTSSMVEWSIGGEVSIDYAPTGLFWRLVCPVNNIVAHQRRVPSGNISTVHAAGEERLAAGRRVLVVEDEPLIASRIESILFNAGFDVIGPAGNVRLALALIEHQGCDAAVLDVRLGDETSAPIAHRLIKSGTPFVVVSGYTRAQLPTVFQTAPLIGKPLRAAVLEAEVKRCMVTGAGPH
jgi:PAS domain S-box-containing protein